MVWRRSLVRGALAGLGALAAGVLGCGRPSPQATLATPEPVSTPALTVVTTFLPITHFTQVVAGERATVIPLLPPNADPHDFQARPQDVQTLATAQVLVKNGLGMEAFLEGLIANANNPHLRVIDTSVGVTPLMNPEGKDHQHSHGHSHSHSHAHGHSHGHSHHHGPENPHIWLDPKRVQQQVKNIRDGLAQADPEGAAIYQANAQRFLEQLQALDQEIAAMLAPFRSRTFVTYHDAAPYFADSYGLKVTFLVGIPGQNPSPADVRRVMDTVRQSDLKTLLTEPGASDAFATLAQDLGVRVSTFDTLETTNLETIPPDYYLQVMRQNAENLRSAFAG
ncbi:MAG: zinc ABC transporter substrate-binding protein [Thermostichales cyanobacterium SZTDM-1c_bins_54]